jgi:predicted nucleic acid-binding protein
MRLVDTSVWIEWLIGSPLGIALAGELPDRTQWLVPTLVQLELAKWLTREVGEDKADRAIAFTETCAVADLDTATALSAAEPGTSFRPRTPSSMRPRSRIAPNF